jgi:hypothetical protein
MRKFDVIHVENNDAFNVYFSVAVLTSLVLPRGIPPYMTDSSIPLCSKVLEGKGTVDYWDALPTGITTDRGSRQ